MSNTAPSLTREDAHNALAFLERVNTKGVKEAVVLAQLANKLALIKQHEAAPAEDTAEED